MKQDNFNKYKRIIFPSSPLIDCTIREDSRINILYCLEGQKIRTEGLSRHNNYIYLCPAANFYLFSGISELAGVSMTPPPMTLNCRLCPGSRDKQTKWNWNTSFSI